MKALIGLKDQLVCVLTTVLFFYMINKAVAVQTGVQAPTVLAVSPAVIGAGVWPFPSLYDFMSSVQSLTVLQYLSQLFVWLCELVSDYPLVVLLLMGSCLIRVGILHKTNEFLKENPGHFQATFDMQTKWFREVNGTSKGLYMAILTDKSLILRNFIALLLVWFLVKDGFLDMVARILAVHYWWHEMLVPFLSEYLCELTGNQLQTRFWSYTVSTFVLLIVEYVSTHLMYGWYYETLCPELVGRWFMYCVEMNMVCFVSLLSFLCTLLPPLRPANVVGKYINEERRKYGELILTKVRYYLESEPNEVEKRIMEYLKKLKTKLRAFFGYKPNE